VARIEDAGQESPQPREWMTPMIGTVGSPDCGDMDVDQIQRQARRKK